MLFCLGRCPALSKIGMRGRSFRVPDRCSILGHEGMRLRLEGEGMPALVDPLFPSESLKFAARAEVVICYPRGPVIRAFGPCLESVVRIQFSTFAPSARIPDCLLREVLGKMPRLEVLTVWYNGIGNGTFKAIADTAPASLEEIGIVFRPRSMITSRVVRLNALNGLVRRLADRCGAPARVWVRFGTFFCFLDSPYKDLIVERTRPDGKGTWRFCWGWIG